MAPRRQGGFDLDRSIELTTTTPVDARQLVRTKEELLDPESFVYGFNGMITACRDEQKLYMLIDKNNPTLEASWKDITGGGGSSSDTKTFVAEYNVTTAQEIIAYMDSANEPYAALLIKRGGDYHTATSMLKSNDETVVIRSIGTNAGLPYIFTYTVTNGTWANSTYGLQQSLVSGTNIKTINGESVLGSGDIAVSSGSVAWNDVTDKPDFANVATSGDYNDLGNKPTIPEAYDDTEVRNLIAAKANSADLANVATSGSYNDLGDKPTIPEAYDDTALAARVTALEEGGGAVTVVQTKGNSTTDVMSQKATTDMVFDNNEIVRIIPTPHENTQLGLRDNVILGSASVGEATSTSVAVGYYVNTYGSFSVGIGNNLSSGINGDSSSCVAIGNQAMATGSQAIAIGKNASALEKNTISFGPGTPRVKGTVWFGTEAEGGYNDSNYRRIGGVYPGVGNNDVVVVEQLQKKQNTLVAGANITLTPQQNGTVEISAADGATITVDAAMSDTSENPVQNKVVLAAIGDAIDVVETAIADRYTKAETDAKIAEAMVDVDNEHFHPVTVLPDPSVAKENHEYVLITYAQDGTTIESETHYLFYDGVFHEKQTQVSLDGYATEAYVDAAIGALDARVTANETAIVDRYTKAEADALLDGKANLQIAAIPGGGGGEEINAAVSQGEKSMSVNYYKDGELPNTLNLNVDSDQFTIPATAYVDFKAAEAQHNSQQFTLLKLTQKQDTLVSGTNIKTVNGESLLGTGDIEVGGGTVDTAMSDTSENAVQNKVIKAYVDNVQGLPSGGTNGQILVRNTMSPDNSEWIDNPVGTHIEVGKERWQGTYTDENGETFQVYSKMVYIPALPATAGVTTYDHGVSNIKQILNIYGFTTDGFVLNAPRQVASDNITIYQASKNPSNQTFSIEVGKDRSSKKAYVVMVYAKNN